MSLENTPENKQPNKEIKKQKVVSKKKKIKQTADQINLNQLEDNIVLNEKQLAFIEQKRKFKDVSHLASIAEEYLSSFALIGYTLQDERVVVLNMPTSKDEAALVDLLRATFVDIASNRP